MLKLHIGCGLKYKKGYVNIDAYDNTVADLIMNAENLDYKNDSVDLIESFQLIEHLGYMNTILTLGESFRVLKTNSSIVIETPDIDKAFELYLKTNDHNQKAIILNWIYGIPCRGYEHKFCFPAGLLRKLLIETGFVDIMENHHEKTFGVPSFTFIAKKPLEINPNYLLIHNLRKRSFSEIEIFKSEKGANYQIDFEKTVLGHTIDYVPRDFSVTTFNELFTNCVTYSLQSAFILVEESLKLNIIKQETAHDLFKKLEILKDRSFTSYLYHIWEKNLLGSNNPEEASLISLETAKNLSKQALFDATINDFNSHIDQTITESNLKPTINGDFFSILHIESTLSQILAKYLKGTVSDEELKLCKALTIDK